MVAITGASGVAYGVKLLRELRGASGWESHLVLSDAGALNCWHELRMKRKDVESLAGCAHHPREANFKEGIIEHFANGIIKKPETTFGNVKADVLALKDPDHFVRGNFCSIILGSAWPI